ncbi:MAG: DUF5675 family protein [Bacteroidota bacterium]
MGEELESISENQNKTDNHLLREYNLNRSKLKLRFWRFVIGVVAGSILTAWTGYLIQQRELDLKELEQASIIKLKEQENLTNYFKYTLEGNAYERLNLSIFYGTILEDSSSRNRWKKYEKILTDQLDEVVTTQFEFDSILKKLVISDHKSAKNLRRLEEKKVRLNALLSPVQYKSYKDDKSPNFSSLIQSFNSNVDTSQIQNLKLERIYDGASYTIGKLYNLSGGNKQGLSFTLEDEYRPVKVRGKTRIPAGKYKIVFHKSETLLTKKYRQIFDWFEWHLKLENVPNFPLIYIHMGNRSIDTEGSILVGKQVANLGSDEATLINSRQGFKEVYLRIAKSLKSDKEVYLEIFDMN